MKILGVIPARFGSTRFPGKPLALIHGVSMIERVYRRAAGAESLSDLVVATDDDRILDHVQAFGGKAVMTSAHHLTGTERCAETKEKVGQGFDVIINIQGDEPYIHPGQIDQVAGCFLHPEVQISTLVKKVYDKSELLNLNIPKVVLSETGRALYFSRTAIPYCKPEDIEGLMALGAFHRHIGIYGFRSHILTQLSVLEPVAIEKMESLEQLRWLANGYSIQTATTEHLGHAVDIPEDIATIEKLFSNL